MVAEKSNLGEGCTEEREPVMGKEEGCRYVFWAERGLSVSHSALTAQRWRKRNDKALEVSLVRLES